MYYNVNKYCIGYAGWCGLGFVRGTNFYKYNYNKYNENESYMYSNSLINGFFGMFVYGNPVTLPITIYKELYRLEVNIRNIEKEKNSSYYNNLL